MFLPFIASNALSSGAEGLRGRQHHITQQYTYSSNKIRKTQNEHLQIVCQNLNSQ